MEVRDAAIYARRSKRGETAGSVPMQVGRCQKFAEQQGWSFTVFTDDGKSGWDPGVTRDGYEEMVQAIQAGDVSSVVLYKADRLLRDDEERARFERLARAAGVDVYLSRGTRYDLSTGDGRNSFRLAAQEAVHFSDTLSERIADHHEELAAGGYWNGGPRPFGYRVVGEKGARSLEPVPEEAAAVREAAAAIIDGEGLRTVTRRWNEQGLRTPSGNLWAAKAVKGVLVSSRVAGLRQHRGQVSGKASWPGIVDRRTWKEVKAEFKRRAGQAETRQGRPDRPRYLMTGLLRCTCGRHLNGNPNNGTPAYACLRPGKDHPGTRVRVNARPAEEHVTLLAAGMERDRTDVHDPGEAPELQQALDELDERRSAWLRNAAGAGLDPADIREGLTPLNEERQRLEDRLAEEVTAREPATWGEIADQLDAYVADPEVADEAFFTSPETRAWIESLVERVDVGPAVRGRNTFDPGRFRIVWREGVREQRRKKPNTRSG
jgi:site-specific DNA recombinase